MSHKRRSPRHHTVHTRDPRYDIRQYGRGTHYLPGDPRLGLETRGGVTKTIHAWEVDDGLDTQINYPYDEPAWRRAHNLTDSTGIDDPASAHKRKGKRLPPRDEKKPTEYIHETLRKLNPSFMTQYHIKNAEIDGDKLRLPIRRGGKQVDVTIKVDGDDFEVTAFDLKANKIIYQEDKIGKKNLFDAINLAMKKAKKHKPEGDIKKINNQEILSDARSLSSGTIATITGNKKYEDIDKTQGQFVNFIQKSDKKYNNWQEAWKDFDSQKIAQRIGGKDDPRFWHIDTKPASESALKRFGQVFKSGGKMDTYHGVLMNNSNTVGIAKELGEVYGDPNFASMHNRVFAIIPKTPKKADLGENDLLIDDSYFSTDNFRKAVNALGGENIIVRTKGENSIAALQNRDGEIVFLAPIVGHEGDARPLSRVPGVNIYPVKETRPSG